MLTDLGNAVYWRANGRSGDESLVRVGIASVATGATLTLVLILCTWAVRGGEPADASSAGNQSGSAPTTAALSFDERFSSGQPAPPFGSVESDSAPTTVALSFDERFSSARSDPPFGSVRVKTAIAALPTTAMIDSPAAPAPNVAAPPPGTDAATAVLEPRAATRSVVTPPQDTAPSNSLSGDTSHTAIYDISARKVYLPNGEQLEAHSGLGEYIDDVRFVHVRSRGPTPPNVYELKLRESPFHGVQAIRLNPLDGGKMYGREGILAHPFMLGPDGQSNGCVSFKDYPAFLNAYLRGEITRLVVVQRLDDPPGPRTAVDWFSSKLKGFFGRS
jgi:Protein of unknown function (DUF2778)